MTSAGSPVVPITQRPAQQRIGVVDSLRGFALFGILFIHLLSFQSPGGPPGFAMALEPFDKGMYALVIAFVESKFFSLFSFLFGLGFALQFSSAARKGVAFGPRYARRLLALAVFGALHATLVWEGDILLVYACVGGLLVFFQRLTDDALLRWVRGLLLVPLVWFSIVLTGSLVARAIPSVNENLLKADAVIGQLFGEIRTKKVAENVSKPHFSLVQQRFETYLSAVGLLLTRIPTILAMFVLGLYVGRRGILEDLKANRDTLERVRALGLGYGIPIGILVALGYSFLPEASGLITLFFNQYLAGPILGLGYGAAFVLAIAKATPFWQNLWAMPGRMALTNYVMQSVILTLVYNQPGLRLAGTLSPLQGVALGFAIFALQMTYSALWMRFFRFGPLEWLWRCITYAAWQPIRRQPRALQGVGD